MADMADQLKAIRTTAKRQFSRLANDVSKMHTMMSENELRDAFKKLTEEANTVLEANNDLEDQYIEENGKLNEQQKADIKKTANECQEKFEELKDQILKTLWVNYGDEELNLAVEAAEKAAERVASTVPSENTEAFDFLLEHLERLFRIAKELNTKWKCWAPTAEQKELQCRVRDLERALPELTARKAEFIKFTTSYAATSATQLKPASLPKFPGTGCDFSHWRSDWEALQKQGSQTGSEEVKKSQLLDSIDECTARELQLSTYPTADDIFKVLNSRYGNKTATAIEIVKSLQGFPSVKAEDPKQILELIQLVEKALIDLNEIGETTAITNPLVTKSIEEKLPDALKKEWLIYLSEKSDGAEKDEHFNRFLAFLRSQEEIYKQLVQLSDPQKPRSDCSRSPGCVVCGESKHELKLYFCKRFRMLKLVEKRDAVRRLGACEKCLQIHNEHDNCTDEFFCKSPECRNQNKGHHYYLCPRAGNPVQKTISSKRGDRNYTGAQKQFVRKLPPELAAECRHVFSNFVSKTSQKTNQPTHPGKKLFERAARYPDAAGSYIQCRVDDWHRPYRRHKVHQGGYETQPQRAKTSRS